MSRIRPDELEERFDSGADPFVLDIRPESSYDAGAIDGSYSIPVYGDLQSGDE